MQSWVEKYRPKSLEDVVGNTSAVQQIRAWAESWEKGKPSKKAVILAGKPGIGKTTAALALANDMNWQIIEMNASDSRNAEEIHRVATLGAISQTFFSDGSYARSDQGGRKLIVLDEADNLFGIQDRGGVGAIVETINTTGQPIILIVNDLYELTRRSSSIKRLCKTIKFQRLHATSMKSLLKKICKTEGITVADDILEYLIGQSQGDLRSVINDLQSLSVGRHEITDQDVSVLGNRDTEGSIFNALAEIFRSGSLEKARMSMRDLDESPETMILWIDENMPAEYRKPDDLARGYSALSKSDVYLGRVTRRQHYGLWSYSNDLMTGGVAVARQGRFSGGQYRFPFWLIKMSRSSGLRRTIDSLAGKLGKCVHTSKNVVMTDILPTFRQLFRQDNEFRLNSAIQLELDEREIAFLLGESEDSHPVKHLIEAVNKVKSVESESPRGFERFETAEDMFDEDQTG